MFSKTQTNPTHPLGSTDRSEPFSSFAGAREESRPPGQKLTSLIANDMTIEGNISGGAELQIEGTIKGDVRIERVTIAECGQVEGGVYAETVEVLGKVTGSITAKQVRLYGACHVDGDITHEQLAMETGAFFQGRSLRLQRPAPAAQPAAEPSSTARSSTGQPSAATSVRPSPPEKEALPIQREGSNGGLAAKPTTTP